jgi:hypothetical protein
MAIIDKHADLPAPGQPGAPTPQEWLEQANKPVPDGVRPITQSRFYDPSIDGEDEMRESGAM